MFVKISPYGAGQEAIYEIHRAVAHYGSHVSEAKPSERLYEDEIGASFNLLHVHGIEDDPSGVEEGTDYWVYKYAWWWVDGDQIHGVVTSQRLFILSDEGHTIDKVR